MDKRKSEELLQRSCAHVKDALEPLAGPSQTSTPPVTLLFIPSAHPDPVSLR